MNTIYAYWLNVVAYDKATGDSLAGAIGNDTGDGRTFDYAIPCYPAGTTFTVNNSGPLPVRVPSAAATAWAVGVPAEINAYTQASTFAAGGYPTALTALGYANAQIDAARSVVKVQAGDRATLEGTLPAFVASLNLVM